MAEASIELNTRSLIAEAMEKAAALNKRRSKKVKSSAKASSNNNARTKRTAESDPNSAQASASNIPPLQVYHPLPIPTSARKFSAEDVEEFIRKIYFEIDFTRIDAMLSKKVNRRSRWPKLVLMFRKRMLAFVFGFHSILDEAFIDFFDRIPLIRLHVFHVMACHCLEIMDRCPGFFVGFIYVFCFMYSFSLFLKERDMPEFERTLGCECTIVFYEYFLKQEFECFGGLDGLQNYLSENTVYELIQYVTLLYCDPLEFTTTILIRNYEFLFGVKNNSSHYELAVRLPLMKAFLRKLYPAEMAPNTLSYEQILSTFTVLRRELILRNNLDVRRVEWLIRKREEDERKAVSAEIRLQYEKILSQKS